MYNKGAYQQDKNRDMGEMATISQPGRPWLLISRLRLSQWFENQQRV